MSFIIHNETLKAFRTLISVEKDLSLHLASKMDGNNKIYFPVRDREWVEMEAFYTQFHTPRALIETLGELINEGFVSFTEEEDIYLLNPKYVQPVKQ